MSHDDDSIPRKIPKTPRFRDRHQGIDPASLLRKRSDYRSPKASADQAMAGLSALPAQHQRRRFTPIHPADFKWERQICNLSIEQCAASLFVTPKTIRNWENGRTRIPYSAYKVLRLLNGQELVHPDWKGWTLVNGALFSPVGQRFDRAGLQYLWLIFAGYRAWKKDQRLPF